MEKRKSHPFCTACKFFYLLVDFLSLLHYLLKNVALKLLKNMVGDQGSSKTTFPLTFNQAYLYTFVQDRSHLK